MKTLKLLFLIIWAFPGFALNCHPKVNAQLPQYIIGYGSLIDEQSKLRTDPTAEPNLPVLITGYRRLWGAHGNSPGFNTTFLAVTEDNRYSFNGVIYKLSWPLQIKEYDKRENIYCRKAVHSDKIKMYAGTLPESKQIWIYESIQQNNQSPSAEYPIVQSYVDIYIRGCIQIEDKFKIKNFAKNCIKSTANWSDHWVNDRIFPRRPGQYEPFAGRIDALLKETLPAEFKQIRLE